MNDSYKIGYCRYCHKEYSKYRKRHIYCSNDCNKKHYYITHRKKMLDTMKKYCQEHKNQCNQYKKAWKKRNPEKNYAINKNWRKNNRESFLQQAKRTRERYPEKIKARNTANRYIRVKKAICKMCGSNKKIERHHPDYSKPLNIIMLCRECHSKIHSEKQNG